ncbi:hypothetical protein CEQ34_006545 [Staphylococcus aureus]|nr:hypothetical protein CEQ34_006545 [Staphylococcus aureus]PZH48823.1 hypothetical protein C7Q83_13300 [Staphylococcus aureus]PZH67850.1 hypothetical protein C7Q66_12500 [Staphylococcus aureus]PZI23940.1 hypothetical protein C7R14_12375 [Staphylococcus aureus]
MTLLNSMHHIDREHKYKYYFVHLNKIIYRFLKNCTCLNNQKCTLLNCHFHIVHHLDIYSH